NPVEKNKIRRSFCQQTKSEKNRCRKPHEPRRLLLKEEAQPKKNPKPQRDTKKPSNSNNPAFPIEPNFRQPDHSRDDRASRAEARPRDRDERNGYGKDRKSRRQSRRPFVAYAKKLEGCRYEPVHQWRLAVIGITTHLRNDIVSRLKHLNSR